MPRSKAEPMEEVVPETPDSTRSRRSSRISTPVTPAATAAPAPRRRAANRSSAATNTTGGSTTANTSRNPTDTPDTSIDSAEEVEGLAQDSDELDFLTKAAPKKATTSKNTPAAAKAGTKRPVAAAASSSKGPPAGGDAPEKVRKKKFIRKPQRSYARCMTVSKRLNSHGKITNISDATSTSEEEEEEEEEKPTLPVRRHGHYMRLVSQSDFEDDEDEDEDEDDGGGFVPAKPPKKRARNDKGKAQEKSPAAAGSSKLPTGGHAPMRTTRIAAGSHALKRGATKKVDSGSKAPRIGRYMSTKKRMNWKGEVVNLADDSASEEEEEEEEEDEGGFVPTMPARKRARNNNGTAQDPVVAPATPQSKDKGKGKATAFRVEESDSELTEEEEEEDSDDPLADLHARIGASERRLRGGATRTSAAAADDGGDAVMADISAATAGSGGFMADLSRLAGLDSEEESDYEEEQDDEEMDEDDLPIIRNAQPVRAVGSAAAPEAGAVAGPSKGSMQEEQQYETAKQRKARLKSEAYQARLKEKKTKSHYERTREALNAHHPELRTIWEDLGKLEVRKPQKAIQPDGLTIKLLPFQLEGVDWLIKQEKSEWKGGMLADEMGMGKTIQMISLFLSDVKKKKGQALVIAPTVAIMQWRNEIQKYTNGFKVLVWHGINRANSVKELQKYDIILTSYQTLERTFSKQEKGFKRKGELIFEESALHALHWHRIILDEAHNIKERSTNVAKAAFELDGDYRWCLSGTPLQNRVGELYSMIRFLGGDPYAFYYCKRCPCKSLHWTFSDKRHCDSCGHTPMHHTCFWNNEILKPIQRGGMEAGEGKEAFQRLRLLLEQVMLRRTKLERADDMGLPPRTVEVRRDTFHEEEEDLYESLYKDTTRKFSTYLGQGTVLNNYSNIFTLLTRMRQMANHPDLVLRSKTGVAQNLLADDEGVENRVCKICTDVAEDPIMSRCRHVFCRECIRQYLDTDLGKALAHDCPYCHATLTIDLEQEAMAPPIGQDVAKQGIISRLNMSKWRSSTKIEALVEELTNLRAEDKTIKSIVFSQFVNFLDLIAFRLQRAGFSICRLEGNMTPEARDKTIKHFMENPGVTVFLVSLKAGGVALNLTEASHCYLMDPWWNPSVEVQAMDRIHRLGQHRPIVVKRMIIENSIESRIIELQNKKAAMIEAAIGKDDSAMGRLSVQDLKFLFTL